MPALSAMDAMDSIREAPAMMQQMRMAYRTVMGSFTTFPAWLATARNRNRGPTMFLGGRVARRLAASADDARARDRKEWRLRSRLHIVTI
jgi:hypothetical protein